MRNYHELSSFINNGDSNSYDLSEAKISSWTPNVANPIVFTRIVIPNKSGGENAVLYITYLDLKVLKIIK